MALKSAELAGLRFPRSAYEGAGSWFDEVTETDYFRVGYTHRGTGKVFVPGMNENYDHHEALTAIGMLATIFVEKRPGRGADLLVRDLPRWNESAIDFYYWHLGTQALFQQDGPDGSQWRTWNDQMKRELVLNQNAGNAGCAVGSWEPVGRWCCEGGRVYATAINALTLETYYRYARVLQ
jgi:hypothetical protein